MGGLKTGKIGVVEMIRSGKIQHYQFFGNFSVYMMSESMDLSRLVGFRVIHSDEEVNVFEDLISDALEDELMGCDCGDDFDEYGD